MGTILGNLTFPLKVLSQLTPNPSLPHTGKNALNMMEGVSKKDTTFMSASHSEHVRPMLMLTWTPFLAVFSITLQDSNDAELIALCLDGFRCAVRVSCIFNSKVCGGL